MKALMDGENNSILSKIATKEVAELTQVTVNMVKGLGGGTPSKSLEFESVICKTNESSATCDCTAGGKTENVLLKKVEGKWLISGLKGKEVTQSDIDQTKAMFEGLSKMNKN